MMTKSQKVVYMKDWVKKLDAFLQFNEKDILQNLGLVSHEVAISLAEQKFEKFSAHQDENYISDFDQAVKKYLQE